VGELVWVLNPKVPKNSSKKLFHPWNGPFRVIKKLSECTYRIQRQEGRKVGRQKTEVGGHFKTKAMPERH